MEQKIKFRFILSPRSKEDFFFSYILNEENHHVNTYFLSELKNEFIETLITDLKKEIKIGKHEFEINKDELKEIFEKFVIKHKNKVEDTIKEEKVEGTDKIKSEQSNEKTCPTCKGDEEVKKSCIACDGNGKIIVDNIVSKIFFFPITRAYNFNYVQVGYVVNGEVKHIAEYDANKKLPSNPLYDAIIASIEKYGYKYNPKVLTATLNEKLMDWRNYCDRLQEEEKKKQEDKKSKINNDAPEADDGFEKIDYIKDKITLQQLQVLWKKWFYIENVDCLDVTIATALSQQMAGDPAWLMLIAPPGSLKTELIRSLGENKNEFVYPIGDLTKSSLVTGYKDGQDLVPKLDNKIGTIKDFTTILNADDNTRRKVFSDLRELYDGYISKNFGGDVSEKNLHAHTTIIGGVTPAIERYKMFFANLGDRFLHYRIRYNAHNATIQAQKNVGKESEMRAELKLNTLSFLKQQKIINVKISNEDNEAIQKIANFIALCRTDVARDYQHVMICYPDPEQGTRLVKQLTKLAKCLAIIRGRDEVNYEEINTIRKIGFDTCPEMRVRLIAVMVKIFAQTIDWRHTDEKETDLKAKKLKEILKNTTTNIANRCNMPTSSAKYVLEDMKQLGIVRKVFTLTEEEKEEIASKSGKKEDATPPEKKDDDDDPKKVNVNHWELVSNIQCPQCGALFHHGKEGQGYLNICHQCGYGDNIERFAEKYLEMCMTLWQENEYIINLSNSN